MTKILITGAAGQIGSELTVALRQRYGAGNVIACGHKTKLGPKSLYTGPFVYLDIRNFSTLVNIVKRYKIDTIFHLAGILSAVAEQNPQLAWDVNMTGLTNVLEVARVCHCAVFFPSSIGAFGPSTPLDNTPQLTIQRPQSMYGITKVAGELLCDYYWQKYAVDTRGLRFPGLISYETRPGGGTTDYAVEIFYGAIKDKKYCCFLKQGTRLDMMYMQDALRAAITLMEADPARLTTRNAFNVTAMSFAPEDIFAEIKKSIPDFTMTYEVDLLRQAIADSWPNKMDDSEARKQWGWQPEYDLPIMTREMIDKLSERMQHEGGKL
ncbi:MAG: L-threonine 3-dehydrogenase [Proteobacteria bacterium]|nr:L-threonine 3-dehydrogenase [Pseudomonadota bacterium]MBU1060089.1 L-threonine 3-dehydrogenase [Pseudomonadota bacterium]